MYPSLATHLGKIKRRTLGKGLSIAGEISPAFVVFRLGVELCSPAGLFVLF